MTVNPGETFELTIRINPVALGISAADVRIPFHTGAFEINDIRVGSALGTDTLTAVENIDNDIGVLSIAIARIGETSVPSVADALIVIEIRVKGGAEVRDYTFTPSGTIADHQFGVVQLDNVRSGIVSVVD